MENKYYQQGDTILRESIIPGITDIVKDNVIVYGQQGGNNHYLEGGDFLVSKYKDKLFVSVIKDTILKHAEHDEICIPVGIYEVIRVLEYDHFLEESRAVLD